MGFPQHYNAADAERRWQATWAHQRIYEFHPDDQRPIFAIDTPPPTVSGDLHIGHVYSYVQAECMARFWRMQGFNVYYPFGFDDNGLPTERFVERSRGIRSRAMRRDDFIAACLEISREVEDRFETFWKRLGMSVDWRLRYSTIDPGARRLAQWSFLDLFRTGRIYRAQAPNPWCVECQTAIAQAEIDDAERTAPFWTIDFRCEIAASPGNSTIPVATTRPELLPACVAVFVHPDDARYRRLAGGQAITPLLGRPVPILADPAVDPQKGTGAVMCCTFGDTTDVAWWKAHNLALIPLITREGRLGAGGGPYAGLRLHEARHRIVLDLASTGALAGSREIPQTVRVHERCGTPLEILETQQWFVRLLDIKTGLLDAGRQITWHPAFMHTRYEHWVQNLSWDWCISRQRSYGVPFPAWHCDHCGATILADETQLPVDPLTAAPPRPCACGNTALRPDEDVMDTWATSSLSPVIAALRWDDLQGPDQRPIAERIAASPLLPMQLRPQAHDIIRTWAFYTIARSLLHHGRIPWETVMISGHGLDPQGHSIHKSKGNSPIAPATLLDRYGADAVRYWACGGSTGADQPINTDVMRQGSRLMTKLWNAARLVAGRMEDGMFEGRAGLTLDPPTTAVPTDRALLSWLQRLIVQASASYRRYEYAAARDAIERFFWGTFCDNYLELVKGRLYDEDVEIRQAAGAMLGHTLRVVLQLFAPTLPHITEEISSRLFARDETDSIHRSRWPDPDATLIDPEAERAGEAILAITTAVRRFKSARQLGQGTTLARLTITAADPLLRATLAATTLDLRSVSRATEITFVERAAGLEEIAPGLWLGIEAGPESNQAHRPPAG